MEALLSTFRTAHASRNGPLLASSLTPHAPQHAPAQLYTLARSSNEASIQSDVRYATVYNNDIFFSSKAEGNAWMDVYVAFYRCVLQIIKAEEIENQARRKGGLGGENDVARQWTSVYNSWKDVVNAVIKGYSGQAAFAVWTIPVLYVVGKYLRVFALRADEATRATKGVDSGFGASLGGGIGDDVAADQGENDRLEDAARQINRIFGLCISDRAPVENNRKWALLGITNLLFKTYFTLNTISLTKNILRSLQASTSDIPPLSAFPKAQRTTFHYYHGVISFLSEDYAAAEQHLSNALSLCPGGVASNTQGTALAKAAKKNRSVILTHLIPTLIITKRKLPSQHLLSRYPTTLLPLFGRLCHCIRRGDLQGFDSALEDGFEPLVKRRIYLTLERGRDLCLRNVLRRVVGIENAEDGTRRTRVKVEEFWAGIRLSLAGAMSDAPSKPDDSPLDDEVMERDEAECLVANAIYKNLMKGYVSREKSMVVLSKAGAFPGTGV